MLTYNFRLSVKHQILIWYILVSHYSVYIAQSLQLFSWKRFESRLSAKLDPFLVTVSGENVPKPKRPIFGESKRPNYIFTIFNQTRESKHFLWTHWSKCPKVKMSQVKMSQSQNVPSQNVPKLKRPKSKHPKWKCAKSKCPKSKRPKVKMSEVKTSQSQNVPSQNVPFCL